MAKAVTKSAVKKAVRKPVAAPKVTRSVEAKQYIKALKAAGYKAKVLKETKDEVHLDVLQLDDTDAYTFIDKVATKLVPVYLENDKLPIINIVRI
jgi:hypothetical protein